MVFGGDLKESFFMWVPLVLSLSVHEWAHAWAAFKLGDKTAEEMGRLTLNPIAHIDIFGTVLLPLMGVPFGWAKPVPVDPRRFRRGMPMRKGMLITAAAGPISNMVLAVVGFVALVAVLVFASPAASTSEFLVKFFSLFLIMNVLLAAFNLLPVFPLDGSRIADGIMPERYRPQWETFVRFGPLFLIGIIVLPMIFKISLFGWLIGGTLSLVETAARALAGLISVG